MLSSGRSILNPTATYNIAMPVYRVTGEDFEPLEKTSFETERLHERGDMQRGCGTAPRSWRKDRISSAKNMAAGKNPVGVSTFWHWTPRGG